MYSLQCIFTCIFLHVSCIHKYIIVKIDCTFMVSFIIIWNMWCLLALQFRLNHHQTQILYLWIYRSHSTLQKANLIVVQIRKWIWVSSKLEVVVVTLHICWNLKSIYSNLKILIDQIRFSNLNLIWIYCSLNYIYTWL